MPSPRHFGHTTNYKKIAAIMPNMNLIYCKEGDKYFDYCLYPYFPKIDTNGKIKSINLLLNSIEGKTFKKDFLSLMTSLRETIGEDRTVFGVKKKGNDICWELYFYNYQKKDPCVNMHNIIGTIKPNLTTEVKPNENIPYFMFSADLEPKTFETKKIGGFHIYLGAFERRGGTSYLLENNGITMENQYAFFDAKHEMKQLMTRVMNSAVVDFKKIRLAEVLLPELIDCETICVANKKDSDCIYYSRIDVNQLLFFLERFEYPDRTVSFIKENKHLLDHLLFDVGFDYKMEGDSLKTTKSGYYGTF
jgi:hypothetical protein